MWAKTGKEVDGYPGFLYYWNVFMFCKTAHKEHFLCANTFGTSTTTTDSHKNQQHLFCRSSEINTVLHQSKVKPPFVSNKRVKVHHLTTCSTGGGVGGGGVQDDWSKHGDHVSWVGLFSLSVYEVLFFHLLNKAQEGPKCFREEVLGFNRSGSCRLRYTGRAARKQGWCGTHAPRTIKRLPVGGPLPPPPRFSIIRK